MYTQEDRDHMANKFFKKDYWDLDDGERDHVDDALDDQGYIQERNEIDW